LPRSHPLVPRLHAYSQPIVVDPQIAVAAAHDSFGHDRLDFLRHHANIRFIAAIVAEPIIAKAVIEMAHQDDVMFQPDVGPPAVAAAATTTTAPSATADVTAPADIHVHGGHVHGGYGV